MCVAVAHTIQMSNFREKQKTTPKLRDWRWGLQLEKTASHNCIERVFCGFKTLEKLSLLDQFYHREMIYSLNSETDIPFLFDKNIVDGDKICKGVGIRILEPKTTEPQR